MPILNVKVSRPASAELTMQISETLLELTTRVLRKKRELTAIAIEDEKALYISECFAAFARLIGPLHEESYIYVQDVREQAYGYGGLTQEYRYIKSKT